MIALSVSLALLWALAYRAWRDWLASRAPPNDYQKRLYELRLQYEALEARVTDHALRLGVRSKNDPRRTP